MGGAIKGTEYPLDKMVVSCFTEHKMEDIAYCEHNDNDPENCKLTNLEVHLVKDEPSRKRIKLAAKANPLDTIIESWTVEDIVGVSHRGAENYLSRISRMVGYGRNSQRICYSLCTKSLPEAFHFRLTVERRLFDKGLIDKLDNKDAARMLEILRKKYKWTALSIFEHRKKPNSDTYGLFEREKC